MPSQTAAISVTASFRLAGVRLGATRLVPGSHQWSYDREPKPEEIVIAKGEGFVGAVDNGIPVGMIAAGMI